MAFLPGDETLATKKSGRPETKDVSSSYVLRLYRNKRNKTTVVRRQFRHLVCTALIVVLVILNTFHLDPGHTKKSIKRNEAQPSLRVLLFACHRYMSFKRLFQSIENSIPSPYGVTLHVMVDCPESDPQHAQERELLLKYLENISSRHGPVYVHYRTQHFGLKQNVLHGWLNPRENEYAVFLEDDIEVSQWFIYLASLYIHKLHPLPDHVMGVSLFNDRVNQLTGLRINAPTHVPFRLYQQAQSWGAIMSVLHWTEFLSHVKELGPSYDPNITEKNYTSNNWDHRTSWKKYMLHFMFYSEKFLVYPTFPGNKSITTHHVEPSDHFPSRPSPRRLNEELRPELMLLEDMDSRMLYPCINRMLMFDMSHDLLS